MESNELTPEQIQNGQIELELLEGGIRTVVELLSRCTSQEAIEKTVAYTCTCVAYRGMLMLEAPRDPEIESTLTVAREIVQKLLATNVD